jgi:hypothetical protein
MDWRQAFLHSMLEYSPNRDKSGFWVGGSGCAAEWNSVSKTLGLPKQLPAIAESDTICRNSISKLKSGIITLETHRCPELDGNSTLANFRCRAIRPQ